MARPKAKFRKGQRVVSKVSGATGTVTRGGLNPVVRGTVKGMRFQKTIRPSSFDLLSKMKKVKK